MTSLTFTKKNRQEQDKFASSCGCVKGRKLSASGGLRSLTPSAQDLAVVMVMVVFGGVVDGGSSGGGGSSSSSGRGSGSCSSMVDIYNSLWLPLAVTHFSHQTISSALLSAQVHALWIVHSLLQDLNSQAVCPHSSPLA